MSTVDYSLEIYSVVESIAGELFEEDREVEERLEEDFGIDFYPLEKDPETKFEKDTANEYLRAGFGISSLIAEDYIKPQETFFQNRADDFRDFERGLGDHGNQVLTEHLVQYANLYSEIADEEGVDVTHDDVSIALMDKSKKKEAVLQILGELEEGITEETDQREGLA